MCTLMLKTFQVDLCNYFGVHYSEKHFFFLFKRFFQPTLGWILYKLVILMYVFKQFFSVLQNGINQIMITDQRFKVTLIWNIAMYQSINLHKYLWRCKGKLHFKSNQFGQPTPFCFHVSSHMWHTIQHPVYMGLYVPVMNKSEPIINVNFESCVPWLTLLVSPPLLLLSVVMVVVMEIMEVRDPLLSMGRESSKDTSPMSLQSNHRYGDHSRFFFHNIALYYIPVHICITYLYIHIIHTCTYMYVQYTNHVHTTFLNM